MAGQAGQIPWRRAIAGAVVAAAVLAAPASPAAAQPRPASTESLPLGGGSSRAGGASAAGPASGSGGLWAAQTVLSLLGVIAIIGGVALVVRTAAKGQGGLRSALGAGGRAPAGLLEIIGRYPVGRGSTLVLLKLDRRILLLSQTTGGKLGAGAGFQTLCEITDPEEVASILVKARDEESEAAAQRFGSLLARFDRQIDEAQQGGGRRVVAADGGDRVELWDERAGVQVVDLTGGGGGLSAAIGSLRERLAGLRGMGAGHGGRT